MQGVVVHIPNVPEEERIGFGFNYLIKVISETERCDFVRWDFRDVEFLHPFFLAPLAIYKDMSRKEIVCVNMSVSLRNYLTSVSFNDMLYFGYTDNNGLLDRINGYSNKKYTPFSSFALTDKNKDDIYTVVSSVILNQTNIALRNPLTYLISELLDNIYEHSHSVKGYVFSQYLERDGVINLCIADNGITIYNSFKDAMLYQKEIDGNEAESLKLANEGYSTKNLPDAENRGYGIPTSKRVLVDGLKGGFFMLSGGAFHRYEGGHNDYVNLGNIFRWKGTIILMRIPVVVPVGFSIYDYIE